MTDAALSTAHAFVRRARPGLGTLVEIGARASPGRGAVDGDAMTAAFARIVAIESRLSRFDCGSDIHRFNAAAAGACIEIGADARAVLSAAGALRGASDGAFDISLGSGADAWRIEAGGRLRKLAAGVVLDLGGIGKGYAVDRAVDVLRRHGIEAGWVNAGGDLRVFGPIGLPIDLRDEDRGGVRRFATLGDGAFATSRVAARHVSVAAGRCLWADALTKVVAASGRADDPLLARFGARAWLH